MLGGTIFGSLAAVTPDDAKMLAPLPHGLYIGVTGAVVVETLDGAVVTFVAVPAGTILPVQVRKVKSTGTSASSIVALAG